MDFKYILTDGSWKHTFIFDENGKMIKNVYALEIHALNRKMANIRVLSNTKGIVPFGIFANVVTKIHDFTNDQTIHKKYNHVLIKNIWID